MIKIINSSNETLAILQNVVSPLLSEEINREFTFSFTTVIDNDKSSYVNYQNKVEVEDNYFNIVYTEEERTADGLFINAQCEHVSYDLISANFTAGFTATGQFSAVATTLLSGTGFAVGTVEITASETISVNESTNARQLLMQLAALYDGELEFNKYTVSLLTRRGADRGVQFRYRKNLLGIKRIIDNRKKVAGLPTISYSVNVSELEFEQGFIDSGADDNEHYELGDTVKVIDEDLNLEVSLRIVKESHDTEQRMQGNVEIGNFVDNLTDTLTQIQTTSIAKNSIYNGTSIGPENGFVAERSDELVKTSMNATNGITISLRPSITASYTNVFYVQIDTAAGTANLYLAGDAVFTGVVNIGSGNNVFVADGNNGIWLGNAAFGSAPFSVTLSGALTAQNAQITGDILAGSTFTVATGSNTIRADSNGFYIGSSAFSTAPFKATLSGSVTATDLNMSGGNITGGTLNITSNATVGNSIFIGDPTDNSVGKGVYFYNSGGTTEGLIFSGGTIGLNVKTLRGISLTVGSSYDVQMLAGGLDLALDRPFKILSYSTSNSTIETPNADLELGTLTTNNIRLTTTGGIYFSSAADIGFFGGTPASKTSVSDLSAWANVATGADTIDLSDLNTKMQAIHNKVNSLLDALQSYNLV